LNIAGPPVFSSLRAIFGTSLHGLLPVNRFGTFAQCRQNGFVALTIVSLLFREQGAFSAEFSVDGGSGHP
jgi:hypothetical protein